MQILGYIIGFYPDPGSDLYPALPGGIWRAISSDFAVSASSWNFVLFFGSVYEEKNGYPDTESGILDVKV